MKKERIEQLLDFQDIHVVVIGDVMLDEYLEGDTNRMSPEAPIPIFDLKSKTYKSGGAANVAMNTAGLGAYTSLIGVIGNDAAGKKLQEILNNQERINPCLLLEENRKTTTKTRVIAKNQQILRIDDEDLFHISEHTAGRILKKINALHEAQRIDMIIFQDYNKGLLSPYLIENCLKWAKTRNIITALDPKFENIPFYKGIDFFKPNLKEVEKMVGRKVKLNHQTLFSISKEIKASLVNKVTLITLGPDGVFIFGDEEGHLMPAEKNLVVDVSGAGDSLLAICSLLHLKGDSDLQELATIANYMGSLACKIAGVAVITTEMLLKSRSET